jgi:hypothetical protein
LIISTFFKKKLKKKTPILIWEDRQPRPFNISFFYDPTNRLLQYVGEEKAIEDTLYYLDKALESGTLQMDVWLKATRQLAKEQFFARQLILKIIDRSLIQEHLQRRK